MKGKMTSEDLYALIRKLIDLRKLSQVDVPTPGSKKPTRTLFLPTFAPKKEGTQTQ
jgi:hypothetical protein